MPEIVWSGIVNNGTAYELALAATAVSWHLAMLWSELLSDCC